MKIGDEVYIHGYIDEIRKETIIIKNDGGYFGTIPSEIIDKEQEPENEDMITHIEAVQDNLNSMVESLDDDTGYYDATYHLGQIKEKVEQEPKTDGDCISRKAVLDTLDTADKFLDEDRTVERYKNILTDAYEVLPAVNPQEPKTDVLDKIKAELLANAEMHEDGDYYLRDKWVCEIIDKYTQEG